MVDATFFLTFYCKLLKNCIQTETSRDHTVNFQCTGSSLDPREVPCHAGVAIGVHRIESVHDQRLTNHKIVFTAPHFHPTPVPRHSWFWDSNGRASQG